MCRSNGKNPNNRIHELNSGWLSGAEAKSNPACGKVIVMSGFSSAFTPAADVMISQSSCAGHPTRLVMSMAGSSGNVLSTASSLCMAEFVPTAKWMNRKYATVGVGAVAIAQRKPRQLPAGCLFVVCSFPYGTSINRLCHSRRCVGGGRQCRLVHSW